MAQASPSDRTGFLWEPEWKYDQLRDVAQAARCTERQTKVLLGAAYGETNPEIAQRLGVSEGAVAQNLVAAVRKLQAAYPPPESRVRCSAGECLKLMSRRSCRPARPVVYDRLGREVTAKAVAWGMVPSDLRAETTPSQFLLEFVCALHGAEVPHVRPLARHPMGAGHNGKARRKVEKKRLARYLASQPHRK